MTIRRFVFVTALLALEAGCNDEQLPSSPKLAPLTAQGLIVPPSLSNGKLAVGSVFNPANTLGLPTYDDTVLVAVRLENMINVTSAPNTPLQGYSGDLDGSGEFVESVYSECRANVQFAYDTLGRTGPTPCRLNPVPLPFWVDTLRVRGHGSVSRNVGVPEFDPSGCEGGPCHTYGGEQTVSVTPLPALLQISASGTTHVAGGTITFSVSVSPGSIHNIAVPFKILSWEWTPLNGTGQTVACATPVNPCSISVQEDGSMRVTGLANGAEQFMSVGVQLVAWDSPNACPGPVLTNGSHPISSPFGKARPQLGENYPHTGDDYAVAVGTDIFSPRAGRVAAMNPNSRTAGKLIIIRSATRFSWYEHLLSFNPALHEEDSVSVGTWLGKTGNSGSASHGAHLHFEEHTRDGPMVIESGERKGKAPRETLVAPCTF